MKILGKNSLSEFISFILNFLLIIGFLILITSPYTLRFYAGFYHPLQISFAYRFLLALIAVTGLSSLYLVYELKNIFKTLVNKNPFVYENVSSLKRMSVGSFFVSSFYIVKIFVLNSFMTMIVFLVFAMASLFCLVLSEVFREACVVKEENDLTI